jgi:hypothetical protein
MGHAVLSEFPLKNGWRTGILSPSGKVEIWIVEVKLAFRLANARRKTLTLHFAHLAAQRLSGLGRTSTESEVWQTFCGRHPVQKAGSAQPSDRLSNARVINGFTMALRHPRRVPELI